MSEQSMWTTVRKLLYGWDPVRVENRVEAGTPDVNYLHGWVELKYLKFKPKKADTVIYLEHYTPEQRCWHIRRENVGGKVFVLIKISNIWLLLTGVTAAQYLNNTTLEELRKVAIGQWVKKINVEQFRKLLS